MSSDSSDIPASVLVEPATTERVSFRLAFVLCSIFFGVAVTEACSVNLLPLTLALYTTNPTTIFLILAINPAFGFIAQPLVGVLSDRTWTRVGRRAFFLIVCAPLVAVCLLLIPFAARFWGTATILPIVVLVVFLQFFQDMLNGSDQPLLADLVPPQQRTFMLGLVKSFDNLATMFALFVGMTWVANYRAVHQEENFGLPLYVTAAVCQLLFVMVAAFFLGEKPIERVERGPLTPMRYLRDFFGQPILLRLGIAYFLRAFTRTAVVGSVALYATSTLGVSEDEFGNSWGWMPFIALVLGVPLGLSAERYPKHRVLQSAFLAIIAGCSVGYFAGSTMGLTVAALLFGFGDMLLEVTHKAYMSDYYPPDLIGQLSGAVNIFYASGRTAALIFTGFCVRFMNRGIDWDNPAPNAAVDYHVIWVISAASALAGIFVLMTVRDHRFDHIREQAQSAEG